jgi:acetyltransferase
MLPGTAWSPATGNLAVGQSIAQVQENNTHGAHRDSQFGPVVMFGLGGISVEVLQDTALRLAPLSKEEAREMVTETAAGRLLASVRGQPEEDKDAVVEAVRRVSQLMIDHLEVTEADLNPLIVGRAGGGAWAVDARIIVGGRAVD